MELWYGKADTISCEKLNILNSTIERFDPNAKCGTASVYNSTLIYSKATYVEKCNMENSKIKIEDDSDIQFVDCEIYKSEIIGMNNGTGKLLFKGEEAILEECIIRNLKGTGLHDTVYSHYGVQFTSVYLNNLKSNNNVFESCDISILGALNLENSTFTESYIYMTPGGTGVAPILKGCTWLNDVTIRSYNDPNLIECIGEYTRTR